MVFGRVAYGFFRIAWRIENVIVDKLRELHGIGYAADDDVLDQVVKELTDNAKELGFISSIFTNSTHEEGK